MTTTTAEPIAPRPDAPQALHPIDRPRLPQVDDLDDLDLDDDTTSIARDWWGL